MSNKVIRSVVILCIISIALSSFNTYIILNESRIQQERLDQFQKLLDETSNRISTIESAFLAMEKKLSITNQSLTNSISDLKDVLRKLESNVSMFASEISNIKGKVENILNQTPAKVYTQVYKSVVTVRTPSALGSGFVYNNTNLILTNWHVIKGETNIEVEFYDGTRKKAAIVGTDPYSDIALIMVTSAPPSIKPLELGNSSNIYIGQPIVAVGNPFALKASLSAGYISQINKIVEISDVPIVVPVIQLDISIAPGSSGGPLLDLSGKVIGITNAGTLFGFNFAIPSNIIRRVASSIIQLGYYKHPLIGIYVIELTPEVIKELNILNLEPYQTGLLVWKVIENYPAAKAGLRGVIETKAPDGSKAYIAQDIILEVDGYPTLTLADLTSYLEEHISAGQTITLTLWRSGEITSVEV
ncbi:PDZ domain-containing protein, partial [Candidatus Bathyarchaeota archaeon]